MSLTPATYEAALQKARSKPQKPRTPLRRVKPVEGRLYAFTASETRQTARGERQSLSRKAVKRPKRKKKLTTGQLKKRAWKEFSVWVRTRGANTEGMQTCVTCDTVSHWKTLQAGHFIRGRLNSNLFDERGCWVQCYPCNIHRQGNVAVYYKFMLARYGQEVIDELMRQNDQTHKWLPGELQSIWEKYKELNDMNPLLRDE